MSGDPTESVAENTASALLEALGCAVLPKFISGELQVKNAEQVMKAAS